MQLQAPLPRGPGTRVWSRLCRLKLGDHVDFDASAKWQLRHADGAARMDAPLAEHLNKEFRRPIRNSVRFREVRCAVDHDKRSEEHTSELQSHSDLVCRLLLEKKKKH